MANKMALALPDAFLVRYFRGGELDDISKVATLEDGRLKGAAQHLKLLPDRSLVTTSASCPISSDRLCPATAGATRRRVVRDALTDTITALLSAWGVPPASASGVKDLRGQQIRVAKFTYKEASRFFFPRRTLLYQQRMTKKVTRLLRKGGTGPISLSLTVEDYARWQHSQPDSDSPELRYRFATRPPET